MRLPAGNNTAACGDSVWGALASALPQLTLEGYDFIVVVDSFVMGPLLPPYAAAVSSGTALYCAMLFF